MLSCCCGSGLAGTMLKLAVKQVYAARLSRFIEEGLPPFKHIAACI